MVIPVQVKNEAITRAVALTAIISILPAGCRKSTGISSFNLRLRNLGSMLLGIAVIQIARMFAMIHTGGRFLVPPFARIDAPGGRQQGEADQKQAESHVTSFPRIESRRHGVFTPALASQMRLPAWRALLSGG